MLRRTFIKLTHTGIFISPFLSSSLYAEKQNIKKPNLLFIWTDEQRADTMAVYNNKKIKTPHFNKLGKESYVFKNAYVTQAVCTPNRSAVMTGLWPHQNGCVSNNIPLKKDTKCFPELINDKQYNSAYMGKWHLGDEIFKQHGFNKWVSIEDNYIKYYSDGKDRSKRSDYHHFLIDKEYKPKKKNKTTVFSRRFACGLPIEHCKPKFLEIKACEFIKKNKNNPFMLYINFLEPHPPFFGPLNSLHKPSEIDLPENFRDPLEENEPLRYRLKREYCIKKYSDEERKIRELIAKYYGLVSQVDRSVGEILRVLDEQGLTGNTIVVFTSDHGDMMGAHNLFTKSVMYEEATRIPWLIRMPEQRHKLIDQPVSQIDLVPTLMELMNKKIPDDLPGQSLVPLFYDKKIKQDHVFIEWSPGKVKKPSMKKTKLAEKKEIEDAINEHTRAVVSPDGWKLCLSNKDKCQLFNLKKDPGEKKNLYDSPGYENTINKLTSKIKDWQINVNDKLDLNPL